MPQALATRRDARRLGVALHLLLDRFDRQGLLGAFAIPKDIALRLHPWMLRQTLLDTGHSIRRHIHPPIFPAFALDDMQRLLLPINLLQLKPGHLRDAQATAEYHQKQRAVHRIGDLAKQQLDLLPGERSGQATPAPDKATRRNAMAGHTLPLPTERKKMYQRI